MGPIKWYWPTNSSQSPAPTLQAKWAAASWTQISNESGPNRECGSTSTGLGQTNWILNSPKTGWQTRLTEGSAGRKSCQFQVMGEVTKSERSCAGEDAAAAGTRPGPVNYRIGVSPNSDWELPFWAGIHPSNKQLNAVAQESWAESTTMLSRAKCRAI
ncbi:hypothetical protein ASPSYDRAFT_677785 [Aspergillus sydowii CBS 593.65]|uniref:Uncharacterized protein n=1 Tax=Aspergillus sydowii CBS 593.65 TaxID=1036612 RepID=A0A1L9TU74_9EURO|nr:uncharacterized protein ASPSYDRAFT_677785 [Aspergillus sydowii CBS 593.65]OJJ62972.1 hypothetical protein ASPSYDRAFT_677785 [Aspergillus sydowii CBS 593.65]